MKVTPISDPVAGEQILALEPTLDGEAEPDWRQRLNFFSGRALTHRALEQEQAARSGHMAMLAQALSPGVVAGLEVTASAQASDVILELATGVGLTASGEVVQLNRSHRVRLDDLPVFAAASILDAEGVSGAAYRLGDALGQLRSRGIALPSALVLVLEPVLIEHYEDAISSDPCEYDPSDEAFENWQWHDGIRLVLYAWPEELAALPAPGPRRRNRIAHLVFGLESELAHGERLPWTDLGVPVAMIGLDAALEFEFLDRFSVVRRGGEARPALVPITPAGDRLLWQARFEQFNEQLLDWLMADPTLLPAELEAQAQLRHLPPVGVLAKESMRPREQLQHFFPVSYRVQAHAIPYEQLDIAIRESAGLAPFDLNTPDEVQVLVPVPQANYDPHVLVVETLDPAFDLSINRFVQTRGEWLGRRLNVRDKASTIYRAINGEPLEFPATDPGAVDSIEVPLAFERVLVAVDDAWRFLKGVAAPPKSWFHHGFDDSTWSTSALPLGYGAGVATALADMRGSYTSVYLRARFTLETIEQAHRYTLAVRTGGGFYAYLNGHFLQSDNVESASHTAVAAGAGESEVQHFALGGLADWLVAGENVLAVQVHNTALDASAFSVEIELLDTEEQFGTKALVGADGATTVMLPALVALRAHLDTSTPLSDAEVAKLDEIGVAQYITFLEQKIERADDRVEFGFLRLRTDMYRVRQAMLGNEVGTKLATSPALAEFARGDSAVATKEDLSAYYRRLKAGEVPAVAGGGASGAAPATRSAAMRSSAPRTTGTSTRGEVFLSEDVGAKRSVGSSQTIATRNESIGPSKRTVGGTDLRAGKTFDSSTPLFAREPSPVEAKLSTGKEIGAQQPLIGKAASFRNATVGERLEESSAVVSHMAGIAVKGELVGELRDGTINLSDIGIPGVREGDAERTFGELGDADLTRILAGDFDPVAGDDEAAYFDAGIKALESGVALLRRVEGRIYAYRLAIARCKSTLETLKDFLGDADERLKTIGDELTEARHDVSVARTLKAEEEARLAAINAHRDKVLEATVPFLVFRRARDTAPRVDMPVRSLDPDLSDLPLPTCDISEVEPPDALEAILDLVRDAPLRWFAIADKLLPKLSRVADLEVTLTGAKSRAAARSISHPALKLNFDVPDRLGKGIGETLKRSQSRIQTERNKTAALDVSVFQRLSWGESVKRVPEVVSLGDVIDGRHGRLGASATAAKELSSMAEVLTCLYLRFSQASPAIRLLWAERLSQYDAAVSLRNLYTLPRFGELDLLDRHAAQALVDWLFGRVNSSFAPARELVSDLVRMAALLASHSPVNQLIAARVSEPVRVSVGSRVNLVADLSRVRVGMKVSMTASGATVARARVTDISSGLARVEVLSTTHSTVELSAGSTAQIGVRTGAPLKLMR